MRHLINTIIRLFNWIGRAHDGRKYRDQRQVACNELVNLKIQNMSFQDFGRYLHNNGYTWKQDPLWGIFDYVSHAWVTVAKKQGDCDDYAALWEVVFEYNEPKRFAVIKPSLRGHTYTLLETEDQFVIASNRNVVTVIDKFGVDSSVMIRRFVDTLQHKAKYIFYFNEYGYIKEIEKWNK